MKIYVKMIKPETITTGFGVFAESGDPLGEGPFPLVEAFAERKLLSKATR
jgi:hypothetical protein